MNQTTSLFLYGTLRHLPLLEVVLGRPVTPLNATLPGHRAVEVDGMTFPAIRPEPGHDAPGLLLTGVTDAERARLDYYEGAYRYALREVPVETGQGPRTALVYFPDAALPVSGRGWSFEGWAAAHGPATTLAAHEVMAMMPHAGPEAVRAAYGQMLVRAHAVLRARAAPAPTTLRRGFRAEDVDTIEARQPYTRYFAVAEHDLRFPRFDGTMSEPVTRAAFLMGDAVTVLPYDPARDRVVLIEQYRFGPHMRGDPLPWSLEPVAGRIDPGEEPETAARREALEETGLTIGALHHVGSYYPSPGAVTEFLLSYVGLADIPDGSVGIGGEEAESEDILSHILPFDRLMELVDSGEAANGPLILTARWLAMNRDRLRAVA